MVNNVKSTDELKCDAGLHKAMCVLSDEADPRYATVFRYVNDHLPTLTPDVNREFEDFSAERDRRSVQAAARFLIDSRNSHDVLQVLSRELVRTTSPLIHTYEVNYFTPRRGGPWERRVNWNPAEQLIFRRSMDKIEWLLATNLPHVRGVNWDELARDRAKFAKVVPSGLPCAIAEICERIRTYLELIQLANIDPVQTPADEESADDAWLNEIKNCSKARDIWAQVQEILVKQVDFTATELAISCSRLPCQKGLGRTPIKILLKHAVSKKTLQPHPKGNGRGPGRSLTYTYPSN